MELSELDRQQLIEDIINDFGGKLDGQRRNIIMDCPFCGKKEKFGIYVGPEKSSKHFGMANCFRCGRSFDSLEKTLTALEREEWIPKQVTELGGEDDELTPLDLGDEDEIDDELVEVVMPKGYKRAYRNRYLKSRGFDPDDYQYFPCGTTRGCNKRYDDYVLFEIIDNGRNVGFVSRHTWDKDEIEDFNAHHKFQIRRYKNSVENGFGKLLYNIDAVEYGKTRLVILCEGVFDVIALTRKLELYDNKYAVPVCTFGKKISDIQIYKLQSRGVESVVIGYDSDARDTTISVAQVLDQYFDTYIADIPVGIGKDWDEMDSDTIYDIFCNNIKTIREFGLNV